MVGEREEDLDAQNMMKMLEISDHLVPTKKSGPFDLMDNPVERKFIREGVLKKLTKLGSKDRKAFLFTDVLVVTEEKQQKHQRIYEIGRVLPLKGAKLITCRHAEPKKQNRFYVVIHGGTPDAYEVEFGTYTPEDRDSWVNGMMELIMDELGKADGGAGSELCEYSQHHKLLEGTLANAVVTGDGAKVAELVLGADSQGGGFAALACERDAFGASALLLAAFEGQAAILADMLAAESLGPLVRPADWDAPDGSGNTLFGLAARRASLPLARVACGARSMPGWLRAPCRSS